MHNQSESNLIAKLEQQGYAVIPVENLKDLGKQWAQEGAEAALTSVGLGGPNAQKDVHDLLSLLSDVRLIRAGMMKALGRIMLVGILALLATFTFKDGLPFKF